MKKDTLVSVVEEKGVSEERRWLILITLVVLT